MYRLNVSVQRFTAVCFTICAALVCLSQSSETESQLAREGQQALAAEHYELAQKKFEQLVRLEPQIGEAHATLAAIYFKQRQYEAAVREIGIAQHLRPALPRLNSLLGLSLAELGRYAEALPLLEHGFKQGDDLEIRRMCGLQLMRVLSGLRRSPDAVETALELDRLYPNDPEVLYHTGRVFGNQAFLVMTRLHDTAPDSVWMLQAQGEANESQKNYDAAIIAFRHLLVLDPHRPGVHARLGRIYLERANEMHHPEDRVSARREFEDELNIDPQSGNARYEIGQMAMEDNDIETAREMFQGVVQSFPNFEQALVGLGSVYLQDGRWSKAAEVLEKATRVNTEDEVAWYRLSQAERGLGNRQAANEALTRFRSLHASRTAATAFKSTEEVTPQKLDASLSPTE